MSLGMKKQIIANYVYNGLMFFVFVLALTMYIVSISDYKEERINDLEMTGRLQKAQIEKYIQKESSVATELAQQAALNEILRNDLPAPPMAEQAIIQLNDTLKNLLHTYDSTFKSFSIVDVTRQQYIATTDPIRFESVYSIYHPFVYNTAQEDGVNISKIFLMQNEEQSIVLIGKTMETKSAPNTPYVFLIEVDFENLMGKLKNHMRIDYNNQTTFLTNSLGDIMGIFGGQPTNILLNEKYRNDYVLDKINKEVEAVESFKGHAGKKILGYYAKIPYTRWGLITEQNEQDLYKFMFNQGMTYSSIILLVWIGLFLLRKYYNEQMYEYVKEFEGIVKNISEGKDDVDLNRTGYEEVDSLYEAFGKLRKSLKHQKEKQDIILKIANTLAINIELEKLLEELLPNVMEGTKSHWGAFYIMNSITGKLEIKASRGLSKNVYKEFDVNIGEGLVGQAALDNKIKIILDIPIDTVYVTRTFLGKIKPKSIMAVPILFQGNMMGILILCSIYNYKEEQVDIMKVIRYYLGVAISNGITYERTQRLSKELKFQNQLIQNMNDELEDKVRERTDFLDNIINSIKDYSIISLDKEGFITTWNKGAELLKGYKAEEAIGEHISMLYTPEDVKKGKVDMQLETARETGQYVEHGWRTKKNGERFFSDIVTTPMYDENDNLIGFTNITKDITVVKNMEEALAQEKDLSRILLESSDEALLLLDEKGMILGVNQRVEQVTGYSMEELLGRVFENYFDHPKEIAKGLQEIIKRGSRLDWKLGFKLKDAKRLELVVQGCTVADQEGRPRKILIKIIKAPQE